MKFVKNFRRRYVALPLLSTKILMFIFEDTFYLPALDMIFSSLCILVLITRFTEYLRTRRISADDACKDYLVIVLSYYTIAKTNLSFFIITTLMVLTMGAICLVKIVRINSIGSRFSYSVAVAIGLYFCFHFSFHSVLIHHFGNMIPNHFLEKTSYSYKIDDMSVVHVETGKIYNAHVNLSKESKVSLFPFFWGRERDFSIDSFELPDGNLVFLENSLEFTDGGKIIAIDIRGEKWNVTNVFEHLWFRYD